MNSITAADIQRMYTKLKKEGRVREHPEHGHALSAGTVRRIQTMLHRALGDAVKARIIPRNPAEGLALPQADCPAKEEGYFELFLLELATGLRRGEVLALQWDDLDFETGELRIQRQVYRANGELVISAPKTKAALLNQRLCIKTPHCPIMEIGINSIVLACHGLGDLWNHVHKK